MAVVEHEGNYAPGRSVAGRVDKRPELCGRVEVVVARGRMVEPVLGVASVPPQARHGAGRFRNHGGRGKCGFLRLVSGNVGHPVPAQEIEELAGMVAGEPAAVPELHRDRKPCHQFFTVQQVVQVGVLVAGPGQELENDEAEPVPSPEMRQGLR